MWLILFLLTAGFNSFFDSQDNRDYQTQSPLNPLVSMLGGKFRIKLVVWISPNIEAGGGKGDISHQRPLLHDLFFFARTGPP